MNRSRLTPRQIASLLALLLVLVSAFVNWFRQRSSAPPGTVQTSGECGQQYAFGKPSYSGPDRTQAVCHNAFSVLSSLDKRVPLYSASHVVGRDTTGASERTDDFRPDPALPAGQRAELSDYLRSGYDRGHMSPAADFRKDPRKMSESFFLSNMVPQNHNLNAGAWADLEEATRKCARAVGEVYVLTGPIFSSTRPKTVGRNRVAVPDAVFKIVVSPRGDARAFVYGNGPAERGESFLSKAVSISSIEQRTGLTFFPQGGVDKAGRGDLCTSVFQG